MKHTFSILTLLGALASFAVPHAAAQETPAAKKTAKQPAKKESSGKKSATKQKKAEPVDEEDREPDITGSTRTDCDCELGNKLTIYKNEGSDQHIALRWNKRLARMTRVSTTTGADRFENRKQGLVWIGIPAKGMLLDSKKGKQLANECKNAEQMKAQPANASAETAAPASQPAPGLASQ